MDLNQVEYPATCSEVGPFRSPFVLKGASTSLGDGAVAHRGRVVGLCHLNRFVAWDSSKGLVIVEAGMTFCDLLEVMIPKGWFFKEHPYNLKGTVGGWIAAQKRGPFLSEHPWGEAVIALRLRCPNGEEFFCSREEQSDLFYATMGGMGLTGVILEVTLLLDPIETGYIRREEFLCTDWDHLWGVVKQAQLGKGYQFGLYQKKRYLHVTAQLLKIEELSQRVDTPLVFRKPKRRFFSWGKRDALPVEDFCNYYFSSGRGGDYRWVAYFPSRRAYEAISQILKSEFSSYVKQIIIQKMTGNRHFPLGIPYEGYGVRLVIANHQKILFHLKNLNDMAMHFRGIVGLSDDMSLVPHQFSAMYPHFRQLADISLQVDPEQMIQPKWAYRVGVHP